jgi:catechol 2,3-dioxygenase-like lactoylglutathione lyase family enzyme
VNGTERKDEDGSTVEFSHCGVCCSDLELSVRFYCEALGFSVARRLDIGTAFETLTELPGYRAKVAFLQLGGRMLELVAAEHPEVTGPSERRAMNQRGITHLCFNVSDLRGVSRRVEAAGGSVHHQTLTELPVSDIVFCSDLDGTRIELVQTKPG